MSNKPNYRARLYDQYLHKSGLEHSRLTKKYYRDWARVAIGHFKKFLPQDKKAAIVDLGCGHGTMLYALKSLGYENIMGVDCSPEQVKLARKICPRVEQADALDFLRGSPDRFDTIFAIDLLEHLTKDEALEFLDLCWSALVPGGRIILQVPNVDSLRGPQNARWDLGHEMCYTPHSLQQVLSIAGFQDIKVLPAGPVPHGLFSIIRWVLWKIVLVFVIFYDMIEMSRPGSRVHTRVMVASGKKPL